MKRLLFYDYSDLASFMVSNADENIFVSVFCHYQHASKLIQSLIRDHNLTIDGIELNSPDSNGYDKEFQVSLYNGSIRCYPIYRTVHEGYQKDGYLETWSDVAFIHEDCNSKILSYIESYDSDNFYEFAIHDDTDDMDPDYDDYHNVHQNVRSEISFSEEVSITKDKDGVPTSFDKSWSIYGEGVDRYCTFSYRSDDIDDLVDMANIMGIDL